MRIKMEHDDVAKQNTNNKQYKSRTMENNFFSIVPSDNDYLDYMVNHKPMNMSLPQGWSETMWADFRKHAYGYKFEEWDALFHSIDVENDGFITIGKLVRYMHKKPCFKMTIYTEQDTSYLHELFKTISTSRKLKCEQFIKALLL